MNSSEDKAPKVSPLAGRPAEPSTLLNVPKLVTAYYTGAPDPSVAEQRIAFGPVDNQPLERGKIGTLTPTLSRN